FHATHDGAGVAARGLASARAHGQRPGAARRPGCARRHGHIAARGAARGQQRMSWLTEIARPEIRTLRPYEHAIWEPGLVRLHANELPWRTEGDSSEAGLNRYPEPHPLALEAALAQLYAVEPSMLLAARGSDEAIDLLIR